MAECSKCGKQSMSFTCRYCGKKFCSEHRLPENHDCEKLEESLEKEKEETGKWFKEKEVKKTPEEKKSSYEPPTLVDDIKRTLKQNYTLSIIVATTFVFLIQLLIGNSPTSSPFYNLLILKPGLYNILTQPWTLVTVMFLHAGAFHLFANMVTFYFFGNPIERLIGGKRLLKFYFASGIISSLGYVAFRNILYLIHGPVINGLPTLAPAVGASGAVVACFAVVAMIYPKAEVLLYFVFPMKIKTALYGFAAIEVANLLTKSAGYALPVIGGFASSAHLTGLIIGVWYGRRLRDKHSNQTGVLDLLGY